MAKIMIYEDEDNALISRYSGLNKNHDVSVCMVGEIASIMKDEYSPILDSLEKSGFNLSQIKGAKYPNRIEEIPEADVYFTDGLVGDCFGILERLPKNRAYLNTDDNVLQKRAKEEGYNLVSGDLEKIIEEVLNK
jgi:hypothetical protein